MTTITELWEELQLPIRDALHFTDGQSFDVSLTSESSSGLTVQTPFDLNTMLAEDPSWTSSVDGLVEADLGKRGLLWGGEGSYGSEGFIARLTTERSLVWAIFFMDSNPFDQIQLTNNVATFTSTSTVEITVDIDDPRAPTSMM
ncbi:hypothetical protein ACFWMG_34945 [Streptomyces sp. NPDC127074]|uniref:hypothetical protein n=1 Tax=Streptomyces sp. NPDC127074 TaxID=3347130 RepID=UPI003654D93D